MRFYNLIENIIYFDKIDSIFYHPSKYKNDLFNKYEFIGDSHIERAIKDFLYIDYPEESVNFYNKLLNLFVSNESLSVVALECQLANKIKYAGNLTIKLLADTVEALIGCIALQIYIKREYSLIDKLNELISDMLYLIDDDSEQIKFLYNYYYNKFNQIVSLYKFKSVEFVFGKDHNPNNYYFVSILKMDNKEFKGISRTLRRSKLIAMLKFIQSLNISLDFKNLNKFNNG